MRESRQNFNLKLMQCLGIPLTELALEPSGSEVALAVSDAPNTAVSLNPEASSQADKFDPLNKRHSRRLTQKTTTDRRTVFT
mmetsp:Transcript_96088/g.169916  ORF Transcript_96088/g.169916 Transcript_96088/m.169916 type:complete len:82 (+) Transcript_96088:3-248(+)